MQIDMLIRTKRRSVSLQISPKGNLIVRAPINYPYEKIIKLVENKRNWVEVHQARILANRNLNRDILNYDKILFYGYTNNITFSNQVKKVVFSNGVCFIPSRFENRAERIPYEIAKTLKNEAKEILSKRTIYFANLMQLKPQSVSMMNSKRIWGSCDKTANIKYNWRLVMVPPDLIDYVVVHELSHIVEFNHSKMFWEIVKSILPNYKERRQSLKKGDYLLELFR